MTRDMKEQEPLSEEARNRTGSPPVYNAREMRVHDSRQADRLARRLGGQTPAAMNPPGNLAGARTSQRPVTRRHLPLAKGSAVQRSVRGEKTVPAGAGLLLPFALSTPGYAGGAAEQSPSLRRVGGEAPPEEGRGSSRADPAVVADMVYRMVLRDLAVERERGR